MENKLFKKIECKDSKYSIIIEDNGKVAYAYLLEYDQIVGDVWLYNRHPEPDLPEWRDATLMPFLNPKEYINEVEYDKFESEKEFSIKCIFNIENLDYINIYLNNFLLARISPGDKPGYSVLAKKNGPLAKVLYMNNNQKK